MSNPETVAQSKPLRLASQRRIERTYIAATMRIISQMEAKIIEALGGSPHINKSLPPIHADCCDHSHDKAARQFTPEEIAAMRAVIEQQIGRDALEAIDNALSEAERLLFIGGGDPVFNGALYNEFYREIIDNGYKEARAAFEKEATRSLVLRRLIQNVPKEIPVLESAPLVRGLYTAGYDLVTSKITKQYANATFDIIHRGLQNKTPMDAIIDQIQTQVQAGQRWHWKRLVRTELVSAHDKTSMEMYLESGVTYVKWSKISEGACPVCLELSTRKPEGSTTGGYYRASTAPAIPESTHPNCRCTKYPIGNLPKGVKAN